MHRFTVLLLVFLMLSGVSWADIVYLKDGRKLEGKILSETDKEIKIEIQFGRSRAGMTVARKDIARIERGALPDEEFRKRLEALDLADLAGHQALIEWCQQKKLLDQAKLVRSRLAEVALAAKKKANPEIWCRPCGALGEVDCTGCAGKGALEKPCQRCGGSGGLSCRTCVLKEDGLLDCRRCGGAGTYERFDPTKGRKVKTRCGDCSGKGKVECPTCNGKRKAPCKDCKGKGGAPVPCEECASKKKMTCKKCEGSGITVDGEGKKPVVPAKEEKPKPIKKPVIESDPFG
ncbi:MAG: hypothetical protein VYD70_02115 [Planctomycetota bacterium]|nr:hypothetical protein [Planctomycetota bacterium]